MAITQREARERILGDLGAASERLGFAVALLGEAYDQVSVTSGERMEAALYLPVQRAFGRAKRARVQFAERCGIEAGDLVAPPPPGRRSQGAREFIERAVAAAAEADRTLSELQDSMLPIESGDADLRAGLTEVRELLAGLPAAAREFLRTLGR